MKRNVLFDRSCIGGAVLKLDGVDPLVAEPRDATPPQGKMNQFQIQNFTFDPRIQKSGLYFKH